MIEDKVAWNMIIERDALIDKLTNERDKYKKALMLLAGASTEADPILTRVEMVEIAKRALK